MGRSLVVVLRAGERFAIGARGAAGRPVGRPHCPRMSRPELLARFEISARGIVVVGRLVRLGRGKNPVRCSFHEPSRRIVPTSRRAPPLRTGRHGRLPGGAGRDLKLSKGAAHYRKSKQEAKAVAVEICPAAVVPRREVVTKVVTEVPRAPTFHRAPTTSPPRCGERSGPETRESERGRSIPKASAARPCASRSTTSSRGDEAAPPRSTGVD
jgi:hypothetical protein